MMRSPPLHVIGLTAASCPSGGCVWTLCNWSDISKHAKSTFSKWDWTVQLGSGAFIRIRYRAKGTRRSKKRYRFNRSFKSMLWISELSESPDAPLLCFLSTKSTSADQISDRRERCCCSWICNQSVLILRCVLAASTWDEPKQRIPPPVIGQRLTPQLPLPCRITRSDTDTVGVR